MADVAVSDESHPGIGSALAAGRARFRQSYPRRVPNLAGWAVRPGRAPAPFSEGQRSR